MTFTKFKNERLHILALLCSLCWELFTTTAIFILHIIVDNSVHKYDRTAKQSFYHKSCSTSKISCTGLMLNFKCLLFLMFLATVSTEVRQIIDVLYTLHCQLPLLVKAFVSYAKSWVCESQPRQSWVVKAGYESTADKPSVTGVIVPGPRRWSL